MPIHRRPRFCFRALVLALLLSAAPTHAQNATPRPSAAPAARMIPGVSYDIRVVGGLQSGGMAAAAPSAFQNYAGHAVFAASRGRVDINEGGVDSFFTKGDYILFDTADIVVVRPATKDFVMFPHDLGAMGMDRLAALGVKLSVSDVKVTMDSIGAGDTVAGQPTQHFRMTVAFNMAIDAGFTQQGMGTESVTDYWVAVVPGLPGNPLLRANVMAGPGPGGGMFADLTRKADSAAKRMGSTVALRSKTVSKVVQGPGAVLTTEQSSDVSNIRHEDVDASLLVLPDGFTPSRYPGTEGPVAPDAAAKWRRPVGTVEKD